MHTFAWYVLIDMCNPDVYTIFNYLIVQNTNINDQKVLLNIKFM